MLSPVDRKASVWLGVWIVVYGVGFLYRVCFLQLV